MSFKSLKAGIFPILILMVSSVLHSQEGTITSMAQDLARSLNAGTEKRVAVVDFTDLNGVTTTLGKYFAQQLEAELANATPRLELINRTRLNEIMKENKLDATGLTDPDTTRKLGKIAGVEALIVGTVTPLDQTVRLDVEAIDTEDARVLAATSRNILKTRDVLAILDQMPFAPESSNQVASTSQMRHSPQTSKPTQVFESHDIQFILNACSRENAAIVCKLTITNRGDDRNIGIHAGTCNSPPSRLIDSYGREYTASSTILGVKHDQWCIVEGTLVMGIPTQAEVRFENIPSSVSAISLLELSSYLPGGSGGRNIIDVKFHAVPLLR